MTAERAQSQRRTRERAGVPLVIEVAVAAVGFSLVGVAIAANQPWLDAHFLPSFYVARRTQVLIEAGLRVLSLAVGAWLVLVGRLLVARSLLHTPARVLRIVAAIVLALVASEFTLARVHLRPSEWQLPLEEPRRVADARLGWRNAAAHTGHATIGGRVVEYAFDPFGHRVRRAADPVDPLAPTILFTGESVMLGYGLQWSESVPAGVAARLHVQSANLAVNGFGSDQAFMRLQEELPRFRHPVAVVSLFMTTLLSRNLDDDRPHLSGSLDWLPPTRHGPLTWLAGVLVPYHATASVERGIEMTAAVLRATVDLSRRQGATPLIVVPHFGIEHATEETLRRRVLAGDLPFVLVTIDPTWTLPGDGHPDRRASGAIADAISAELRLLGPR